MPKCTLKKVNQKRAELGLSTFEEDEKKRKKRESKASVDVWCNLCSFIEIFGLDS